MESHSRWILQKLVIQDSIHVFVKIDKTNNQPNEFYTLYMNREFNNFSQDWDRPEGIDLQRKLKNKEMLTILKYCLGVHKKISQIGKLSNDDLYVPMSPKGKENLLELITSIKKEEKEAKTAILKKLRDKYKEEFENIKDI